MGERILIFGNSGAGKSTLAARLAAREGLAHLDLDTLAWDPIEVTTRRPIDASLVEVEAFLAGAPRWVIEGCYADLLGPLLPRADALIFLNPGVEACVERCRRRPWEPHKYASKAEQDRNLELLIAWVRDYPRRDGPLSLAAHRALFDRFTGEKIEVTDVDA